MATVNHVRLNNLAATDAANPFFWFWSLTRAMKKAGWKFKASSNGTTKISSADPAADQWGSGSISNAGASAASIAAPVRGRASVTGLTGIVAADKGRFLLISGAATGANNNQHQIEEIVSATEVKIDARNFAVASDANNGALTWTVRNPVGDAIPISAGATAVWWCAQGPSILRIPITSASAGSFVRGENIVQTTTGAEGEFIGYVFSAGAGYLVVSPRVRGTGGGVHGWATANAVTGATSGATVTQVGTAIDYVYEVVFHKQTAGSSLLIFVGQFDIAADSAEMFSFCATQAGATASVPPGGGGTGNAFGTKAWVVWGTGTTAASVVTVPSPTTYQRGHTICVDAISEEDYSADGSWTLVYSATTGAASSNGFCTFGFHRLNDTEDGDLSPYVTVNAGGTKALYGEARTNAGTNPALADTTWQQNTFQGVATRVWFSGWRRRGLSSDGFAELEPTYVTVLQSNVSALSLNSVDAFRIATGTDPTARVREPIWLISGRVGAKMFKGTLKWIYWFAGDQVTDVYGTDPAWVQISNAAVSGVIGPSDGTAWILNA